MRSLTPLLRALRPRRAARNVVPLRRDPAPTLWSYRWQRLMLTPLWRRALRLGLPAAAVLTAAALWLGAPANREALWARVEALKTSVRERDAFMVREMAVRGADAPLAAAIDEVVDVDLPVSSFDVDLDAIRDGVADLAAVREVSVRLRAGGVLDLAVVQRVPVAVWRHADGLRLIDAEGAMTGMIHERSGRADLPLIAGDGAHEVIGEALALFAAAAPIAPRVRGLVRMGERRWDMVLEDDLRLLLPTDEPVPALERIVALHQAQELLDRDVTVVDLRLAARPTLRLNRPALNVLRAGVDPDVPAAPIPEE